MYYWGRMGRIPLLVECTFSSLEVTDLKVISRKGEGPAGFGAASSIETRRGGSHSH